MRMTSTRKLRLINILSVLAIVTSMLLPLGTPLVTADDLLSDPAVPVVPETTADPGVGLEQVATDTDGDGLLDDIDACVDIAPQIDTNGDGCEDDSDLDGVGDVVDSCKDVSNPDQSDFDGDGVGDACDDNGDGDGVLDAADNCQFVANADQADFDGDGVGDACDDNGDGDGDGVLDSFDNCQFVANADQADFDGDGVGDACDDNGDGDGILDSVDNCQFVANTDQADFDGDGVGDACDDNGDADGVLDAVDNCQFLANSDQIDSDSDGIGDRCDTVEPTAIPTSVPTVIPTVVPTVIPTVDPSPTPTSQPTVVPTVAPTPTPVSTSTPTPTPAKQDTKTTSNSAISPMSVSVPGGGIVTSCSQNPTGDLVAPGSMVTIICGVTLPAGGRQDVLGTRPAINTPGFTAAVDFTGFGSGYPIPQGTSAANGWGRQVSPTSAVEITVWVAGDAQPGTVLNASFGICQIAPSMTTNDTSPPKANATCGNGSSSNVGVSLTVQLQETTHFTLTCTPAALGPQTTINTTAASTCTITALAAMGQSSLRIDQMIGTRNSVSGWTTDLATNGGAPLAAVPGTYTNAGTISAGGSYSFLVRFTATGCPAAQANPSVGISANVTVIRASTPGQSVTSSTRTITSSFRSADTSSNAVITAAPATVSKPYNMSSEQTGSANFALSFTVSGCGQQQVSASMSPFARVGGTGSLVPTLASANETVPTNPGGMNVTVADISTISSDSNAPTLLLTGSTNGTSATVNQTINLTYTIPANTLVGTYQSTITVTTGDAP